MKERVRSRHNQSNIKLISVLCAICVLALSALVMNFTDIKVVKAFSGTLLSHWPASVEANTTSGEYTAVGEMPRGRGGMVINTPINYGHELTFDFKVKMDYICDEGEYAVHNRGYVITLNEYGGTKENPDLSCNTHVIPVNGLMLEIRGDYDNNIILQIMNRGARYAGAVLSDKIKYASFYSAFTGAEYEGVTADDYLKFTLYLANDKGEKVPINFAKKYIVEVQCQKNGAPFGEKVVMDVPLENISNNGGFTKAPLLGMYVINERAVEKTIAIDMGIKNISNGRVSEMIINPNAISGLKQGEPIQLNVESVPFEAGTDLSDITYQYFSSDESTVAVSTSGEVSAVKQYGSAYITVLSSEGNYATVEVLLYDEDKPVITLNEEFVLPETITQYDTVTFPQYTVTDESEIVEKGINIISPVGYKIAYNEDVDSYSYLITEEGEYTIEYFAIDRLGNREAIIYKFDVVEAYSDMDWVKYGSYTSASKLEPIANGVHFTGSVTAPSYGTAAKAGFYYSNPLTFTKNEDGSYTSVSFDLNVNFKDGNPVELGNTDHSRRLGIRLIQANASHDIGGDMFAWDNMGFGLSLGNRYASPVVFYELRGGRDLLSQNHIQVFDTDSTDPAAIASARTNYEGAYCQGPKYMPWHEFGSAISVANKFNSGKTVHIEICYYDRTTPGYDDYWNENYYVLALDNWKIRIPAKLVASSNNGYVREAYLGIDQIVSDGEIPFDIKLTNVKNGNVSKISFTNNDGGLCQYGTSFKLYANSLNSEGKPVVENYLFESTNSNIATVDNTGVVKIVGIGECKIIATGKTSQKRGIYPINVVIDKLDVVSKEITLELGSDGRIDLEVTPNKPVPVKYTSSDGRIAAVLTDGTIQAVGLGDAEITIQYMDKVVSCTVHVIEKTELPVLEKEKEGCKSSLSAFSALSVVTMLVGCFYLKKKRM